MICSTYPGEKSVSLNRLRVEVIFFWADAWVGNPELTVTFMILECFLRLGAL